MSLDAPTYLAAIQSNIRARPIPWNGAVRSRILREWHLDKVRSVDKVAKETRKQVVEADLQGYRALFIGSSSTGGEPGLLECAVKQPDIVQYTLVLLSDLLEAAPSLAKAILAHDEADPYQHFLPLLARSDSPDHNIPLLTASVLAALMAAARDDSSPATLQRALPSLLSYLSTLAQNADPDMQDIGVCHFSLLLYGKATRQQFWAQRSETVAPLIRILRAAAGVTGNGGSGSEAAASARLWSGALAASSNGNGSSSGPASRAGPLFDGAIGGGVGLQLLYHVLLVLWQLSFDAAEVGDELNDEYDIVPLYAQLLRLSPKEKTTRLLASTLLNLLDANRATLLPTAVLVRLPAVLANVAGRQHPDPDLQADLQSLRDMLDEYTATKTTFDEYVAEVRTGHLRWSPPHRNPVFWAENARRILDADHGALPRQLAEIMRKPWDADKQVLAIACNDIGALVREVPERRSQLEKLGLKTRVMELMAEADESVRWESLKALGCWLKYSFDTK